MSGKDKDNGLNEQQVLFCHEYVKNPHATNAAKAAGYSEKTARQIGSKLLSKVVIQEYISQLTIDAGLDKDSIIKMISNAINLDQTVLIEAVEQIELENDNGVTRTSFKFDKSKIPKEMRKLLDVEFNPSKGAVLKSPKKTDLLEKLIKIYGLFAPDKLELTATGITSVNLPDNSRMKPE